GGSAAGCRAVRQHDQRLLRYPGRHAARLPDPAALPGTAGDGDLPAELLAARARIARAGECGAYAGRPRGGTPGPDDRGVRDGLDRTRYAGGSLVLQVAEREGPSGGAADPAHPFICPALGQGLTPRCKRSVGTVP